MHMKLKKGDEVKIVRGKDKGKTGTVDGMATKEGKVLVAGVNMYRKHVKARAQNQKSEIIDITKPLSLANVQLICPKCHVPTRVGYAVTEGKKQRMCKKCEQTI